MRRFVASRAGNFLLKPFLVILLTHFRSGIIYYAIFIQESKKEKDKSYRRKSHLNRAFTDEPVPDNNYTYGIFTCTFLCDIIVL